MRSLVISDWHHRWQTVKSIIDRNDDCDFIISLGDEFDGRGAIDTIKDTQKTAEYLLECLHRPNFIWLAGNHTLPYIYPHNDYLKCSGTTPGKRHVIREVMGDYIYHFKFYHWDGHFLYSHAGLNPKFLPSTGFSLEWIKERVDKARYAAECGVLDTLFGAGFSRGGNQAVGGLTWQDWDEDFSPIPGIQQIMGHTADEEPRIWNDKEFCNICLDTKSEHYAITDGSKVNIYNKDGSPFVASSPSQNYMFQKHSNKHNK